MRSSILYKLLAEHWLVKDRGHVLQPFRHIKPPKEAPSNRSETEKSQLISSPHTRQYRTARASTVSTQTPRWATLRLPNLLSVSYSARNGHDAVPDGARIQMIEDGVVGNGEKA